MKWRSGVLFLASLNSLAFIAFGMLAFSNWTQLKSIDHRLKNSFEILAAVHAKAKGESKFSKPGDLSPNFRQEAVEIFWKSPRSRTRLLQVVQAETLYQNHLFELRPELERRIQVYSILALVLAVLGSLSYITFFRWNVIRPITDLNQRMNDFLENKFSYEFGAPENNDIGELHLAFNKMAQKVLDQIEGLTQLDNAKSEFLSIASHELRTPLTSIKGSLALLEGGVMGDVNSETKSLLSIALSETDRLIRLINELLDLAKIEAGQFPLQPDWIDANSIVERTADGLHGLADSAHVKLVCETAAALEVYADADKIQQVVTNLASNAIKFSPADANVFLRIIEAGDQLRFEIQDEGSGIAPKDQELIFEKFRQATSVENPLVKGTGLGLAIVKAIVQQHGGDVGVKSSPGKGSTFYFHLPKWRRSVTHMKGIAS